jgi:branched-chain amino acid transport system substrate-binding protein
MHRPETKRNTTMTRSAFTAAAILALSLFSPAKAADPEPTKFVFGLVVPLTGPSSENGKSYALGAAAGVAMLNEMGGLAGEKVQLVVCDSQNQEQQAVLCTKRLTAQDHARVLIGAGSTPQTIAISPTAEAARVPLFAMCGGESAYTPVKPWIFKGLAGTPDQVPPAWVLAKQRGWKRVAIIHDNSAYGRDIEKFMLREAAESGVELVANEVYGASDIDMTAQVLRIRDANPDVVMNYALTVPAGAAIAKKLLQMDVHAPNIVGINLQNAAFVRLAGGALANTIFVGPRTLLGQTQTQAKPLTEAEQFAATYEKLNNQPVPDSLTPGPADAMLITRAAVAKLGKPADDPEALRAALESVSGVAGLQGTWTFTATDHGPVLGAGITTMVYKDGGWRGL